MKALRRLLYPLNYWLIKHPEKKWYDFIFPAILTVLFLFFYISMPLSVCLSGPEGILTAIMNLLQMLIGFYIASLAAVATFNKPGMDDLMRGTPPTLMTKVRGKKQSKELTRRRFLCLLLGYLALTGVGLYFSGKLAVLFKENLLFFLGSQYYEIGKLAFVAFYVYAASHLIVTTLLGLYYMVDRIHRP